ncbi:uncharacterized protein CC84DRAFT_1232791 [Paraphaeosphaeria sporulosa]|uniref:Mediator of RNA polymerase II transcription subunit 22 n=1 Tax=Paraphaeosphaeria sporulosa TaxID=1460663 RepID=A0A177BVM2_9PLEO|nr:uncharacterized protein CC84DRAFT_1232791 [Paraphaeosphaeria sporulosa]OAF99364.1 hypothetical protein CC84DRAFT_1232791 [Paraphaeosphaeria sporulosa]
MDPKQRNAHALRNRVNDLMNELLNQYRAILAVAREDENPDYSQSAQKELAIKEGANMSMFIRDLQELWLFGGLETLADEKDAEVERQKALEVAGLVEGLVGKLPQAWKVPDGEQNGAQNGMA